MPDSPANRSARILVVEDERAVAEVIRECLDRSGFEVVAVAESGSDAIAMALRHRPDLVLMDIVLPGEIDGVEAARVIRERHGTASVFLSASSDPGVLERVKPTEPAGYIVKPFDEARLRATVEIALYKVGAERALRESREWFSTTLMSLTDAVIATNREGRVEFMNPIAEHCTGWNRQQASGRAIQDVFRVVVDAANPTPAPNPAIVAIARATICHGGDDAMLVRRDQSLLTISHCGAPIRGANGEVTGVVVVFRDVTRERKAEAELRQYHDHLEDLVHERTAEIQRANQRLTAEAEVRRRAERALEFRIAMQDAAAAISSTFLHLGPNDAERGIHSALGAIGEFLNGDAAFILGYSDDGATLAVNHLWCADGRDAARARKFRPLRAADFPWWQAQTTARDHIFFRRPEELPDAAASERALLRAAGLRSLLAVPLREGDRATGLLCLHCDDPDRHWARESLTFLQMCADILLGALTRMRAERENDRLQQQLAHARKMEAVGNLSGGIAHDFNNTLLPIIGYSDMLLDSLDPQDPRAADVGKIRRAAEHAAALTRQLLAFSRKQVISKRVIDLNVAIANMRTMLRPIIGEDIALDTDLSPDAITLMADPGQLDQVVMNLVLNARDAMPRGGRITIRTDVVDAASGAVALISRSVPLGDYAIIEIRDSGCGMKPELAARIFEPFFTTKGPQGTGLGLSVVHGILEQHRGGISVASAPGDGATFTVFLPAIGAPGAGDMRRSAPTAEAAELLRSGSDG